MSTANSTTHPREASTPVVSLPAKLGAIWLVMAFVPVGVWWATTSGAGGVAAIAGVALELGGIALLYSVVVDDLYEIRDLLHAARNGDYDHPVQSRRSDIVGRIYEDFAAFRDELAEYADDVESTNRRMNAVVMEQAEVMSACADGDFTRRMDTDTGVVQLDLVAEEFNRMVADLERLLADVDQFSDGIVDVGARLDDELERGEAAARVVEERLVDLETATAQQSEELSAATETLDDLTGFLDSVAERTDQLASQFGRTADRADEGGTAAREAIDAVETIRDRTAAASETMHELDDVRADIATLVSFISQVTQRAEMLSTKAGVAADRGDTGGEELQALAGEMREFTEETQEATQRIQRRLAALERIAVSAIDDIEATGETIERSTETVETALEDFQEIAVAVERADSAIRQISSETDRGATASRTVSDRIDEVADVSRQTAALSDEISTASASQLDALDGAWTGVRRLTDQATELSNRLGRFETQAPTDGRAGTE
jgi:methyl-accepting chemotaxis protein